MSQRIGFIGLGIMGSRMAANILNAGFELTVWNRTFSKAKEWGERHGVRVASTPAELGGQCDIVISMVVDGQQVESALLGDEGVVTSASSGLLCIDMSTISPTETRRIGQSLGESQIRFIDAPVTGSAPKAEEGTLTIMAGGTSEDFERAKPVLESMGELILHVGPLGQGEMLKLINNSVAAANLATAGEALLLARATNVDLDAMVKVLEAGSGGSTMLTLKSAAMRDHDYTTLFKVEHMLKDVRLCLEECQEAGVPFPSAAKAREILSATRGRGYGDKDFAAMIEALEGFAGVRL